MSKNYNILNGGEFFLTIDASQKQLQTPNIRILCNSNKGENIIYLPKISELGNSIDMRILVCDAQDHASIGKIVIRPKGEDTIENSNVYVIQTNGGKVEIYVSTLNEWGVFASAVVPK